MKVSEIREWSSLLCIALGALVAIPVLLMLPPKWVSVDKCSHAYPLGVSPGKYSVDGEDGLYTPTLNDFVPLGSVEVSRPAESVTLVTGRVNVGSKDFGTLRNIGYFRCGDESQDIYLKINGEVSRYRVFSVDSKDTSDITPEVWNSDSRIKTLVLAGLVDKSYSPMAGGFPGLIVVKAYQV